MLRAKVKLLFADSETKFSISSFAFNNGFNVAQSAITPVSIPTYTVVELAAVVELGGAEMLRGPGKQHAPVSDTLFASRSHAGRRPR